MTRIRWLAALLLLIGGLPAIAAAAPGPRPAPPGPSPAEQYPELKIAAVVNDEVISVADLDSRIRMVLLSTSIPDTPDARRRLASQVLRTLIDEKLQIEEAKRKNIVATESEINQAITSIAQQNNMTPDQLDAVLKANGIEFSALADQVRASIVWAKLVRQIAANTDPVSDEEIDETLKRLKRDQNEPESRVAEIFLAVDNPQQDDEVRALAERLTTEMKQGARFSAVARQFSQSPTAAVGGDLGWVHPDELSPQLAKAVEGMHPGELSPPIRTPGGYYLMLVLDRRENNGAVSEEDTVLHLAQVVFPLAPQAGADARQAAFAEAQKVTTEAKSCADMIRIGKASGSPLSSEGDLRVSQIAPGMRSTVLGLGIGQPSHPILQKNGIGVIMVCDKAVPKPAVPTREDVAESLMQDRLDMLARRYMEDLRRAAYVDVRV
jgi:peptidyl-prolyl cis-trans isomerase SurA